MSDIQSGSGGPIENDGQENPGLAETPSQPNAGDMEAIHALLASQAEFLA